MKSLLRRLLHRTGWDLFRYPQSCERASAHLAHLLTKRRFDLVLDVGANAGQFGRELREAGYHGPIVSFEPIPEISTELEKLATRDSNWIVRRWALGRETATLPLNVMKSSDFSSFLITNEACQKTFPDGSMVERVVEVPVRRLDEVLADCLVAANSGGRAILLKMDTQGYDEAVLDGASGCLDRVTAVMTEVSVRPLYSGTPRYLESIARLETLGFELTGLFPVTRDEQLRVLEFNCVMVRPQSTD